MLHGIGGGFEKPGREAIMALGAEANQSAISKLAGAAYTAVEHGRGEKKHAIVSIRRPRGSEIIAEISACA